VTAGDGIRCPKCNADTCVIDTRHTRGATIRRRQCVDRGCLRRLTTEERSIDAAPRDMVLVPRAVIRRLRKILKDIYSPSDDIETACASPEPSVIPVIE
jgi:transcriptional regulator NrdR family protein